MEDADQFARGLKDKDRPGPDVCNDPVARGGTHCHRDRLLQLSVAEAGHHLPIQGELSQLPEKIFANVSPNLKPGSPICDNQTFPASSKAKPGHTSPPKHLTLSIQTHFQIQRNWFAGHCLHYTEPTSASMCPMNSNSGERTLILKVQTYQMLKNQKPKRNPKILTHQMLFKT